MRDVARASGVSPKTVSRVFRGEPNVSPETQLRVRAAIAQLGYVPNMLSQAFRRGSADSVVVAVTEIHDPFFAALIAAIETVLVDSGISVAVTALGIDGSREQESLESLLRGQVRGLITTPAATNQRHLAPWQSTMPVVFVDREPHGTVGDSVTADDFHGGYLAASHLLRHGHRRIAFLGDSLAVWTTTARLDGYRAALAEHGVEPDPALVWLGFDTHHTDRVLAEFAANADPPTAFLSSNERTMIALIPGLRREPWTRAAYVAFGDFAMADLLQPAVTVVDHDPRRMGTVAAERLLLRLRHPDRRLQRRIVLPVHLIERGSGEVPGPFA